MLANFGQPRFVEVTSFFSGSKPKGSMLVKIVVKHKNKIVTRRAVESESRSRSRKDFQPEESES